MYMYDYGNYCLYILKAQIHLDTHKVNNVHLFCIYSTLLLLVLMMYLSYIPHLLCLLGIVVCRSYQIGILLYIIYIDLVLSLLLWQHYLALLLQILLSSCLQTFLYIHFVLLEFGFGSICALVLHFHLVHFELQYQNLFLLHCI